MVQRELDATELELIDLCYQAAVEPTKWTDFAQALSASCGGAAVAVIRGRLDRAEVTRFGFIETGVSFFGDQTGFAPPFGLSPPASEIGSFEFLDLLHSEQELLESRFYRELMQPRGLAAEAPLALVLLAPEGRLIAVIGICRTRESRPLGPADRERCNKLVGHFARACRLESELRNVRDRRLALAEAIDRFPTGVILVDSKQQRVLSNRCAERVLALSDGLTMVDERPTADRSNEARALREAISAAIAESTNREEAPPRIVALSRPSGKQPLQLMVAALRDAPDAAADGQPVAVLFVPDPQSAQVETTVLEQLYSLTPSEASFIAAFVAERSLDDAATARGIRKSTARGYLKNVFQKTGTNSQHGLMRLLLTGIGRIEKP